MKIIHCPRRFTQRSWGGTETCLLNLAKQQQADGHDVSIFTTKALDTRSEETIGGIRVRRFDYIYPWFGLSDSDRDTMDQSGGNLFSFTLFNALLREPGVDLIHAHTGKRLGGIVRTAAKLRGIPYGVSVHGGINDVPQQVTADRNAVRNGKIEWGKVLGGVFGARRVMRDADRVFCLSHHERKAIATQHGCTATYLPNGVESSRFCQGDGAGFREKYGINPDSQVMLVMARIDPQKNQHHLVRLLPALKEQLDAPHLLLIGHVTDAGYHEALEADIKQYGLTDDVTLIPGLPYGDADIVNAYHAADVFCLPSVHEPFGLVILEAWAAGLPVVASSIGGIPDFVRCGEDALLCEPGCDNAWSDAIRRAMDKTTGRSLGANGRSRAFGEFDWAAVSRSVTQHYQEITR